MDRTTLPSASRQVRSRAAELCACTRSLATALLACGLASTSVACSDDTVAAGYSPYYGDGVPVSAGTSGVPPRPVSGAGNNPGSAGTLGAGMAGAAASFPGAGGRGGAGGTPGFGTA